MGFLENLRIEELRYISQNRQNFRVRYFEQSLYYANYDFYANLREGVSLVFDRQVDVFILALETSLDITCR